MLSFGNTTTFRTEDDHVKLKQTLKFFTGDLQKVVNVIELMLKNERFEYFIVLEEAKSRFSMNASILELKNLRIFINSYVLKLIRKKYDKFFSTSISGSTSLFFCIKTYELSMGFSCAHVFERRHRNSEIIQFENVHFH